MSLFLHIKHAATPFWLTISDHKDIWASHLHRSDFSKLWNCIPSFESCPFRLQSKLVLRLDMTVTSSTIVFPADLYQFLHIDSQVNGMFYMLFGIKQEDCLLMVCQPIHLHLTGVLPELFFIFNLSAQVLKELLCSKAFL